MVKSRWIKVKEQPLPSHLRDSYFLNVLKVHSHFVMKLREHSLDCTANLRFKTSESEIDLCYELEVRGG